MLIVEDSPEVGALHRRLVDGVPEFRAIQVVSSGEAAYNAVKKSRFDLAILDLTMPGGDGLTFLRRVRSDQMPLEVIVVTASRDAPTVLEAVQLGIVDYLVKPFSPDRLHGALDAFAGRSKALLRRQLAQFEVDLVQSSGAARLKRLPKGLRRSTLNRVISALERSERSLTSDEVGRAIGVARVTARRYLEYLDVIGAAQMEREGRGPGRPRNRYRASTQPRL